MRWEERKEEWMSEKISHVGNLSRGKPKAFRITDGM